MRSPELACAAALAVALVSCTRKPTISAADQARAQSEAAARQALEQADAAWAQRVQAARLTEALDRYEDAHDADPSNRHALVRLTRGWYLWGDAFTEDPDEKIDRWATAIAWGERCLALNPTYARRVAAGDKKADAIEVATESDVPCIFWTATALGKWARAQSLSKTLRHLPTVKAWVRRAESLDPSFYHYGPARYWGAYYAALPAYAGRDLSLSAQYFQASLDGAPYYLPTRTLRAEYLAVATQDVALFDDDLQFVITADPDARPVAGVTPENTLEREKARALLARRHELFDDRALSAAATP